MVVGFADLHNHQFAHLGFGGRVIWGGAYGDISEELAWCTPFHGLAGAGDLIGNLVRVLIYGANAAGVLGHSVGGYPVFDGWPRWNSLTHQTVFQEWLRRAVDGGLRLMVMLAVNNEHLCGLANRQPGRTCDDMEAVDLQLQAAHDMEAYVDTLSGGPGRGWYRIVRSPDEARRAIAAGNLAVVLGIEVDYLFSCRMERDLTREQLVSRLDKYYELGVRYVFPIHFGDNGFGGTAFENALVRSNTVPGISAVNPISTIGLYTIDTESSNGLGYTYRAGHRNTRGLTDLGRALIRGLIQRGMVIDVDHMSAYSKADTLDICEAMDCPVVSGHSGFVEISRGDKAHEGQLTRTELERILSLGGMVSPIVRQGVLTEIATFDPGFVPHVCGNSANTFAQTYLYAAARSDGAPVALGTDFNGFAGVPGPRFGVDSCPGGRGAGQNPPPVTYPFIAAASGSRMNRSVAGNRIFDFNLDGLAHVGMLPDLVADLQAQGIRGQRLQPLLNSADGFVGVWRKAWSRSEKPTRGALPWLSLPLGSTNP